MFVPKLQFAKKSNYNSKIFTSANNEGQQATTTLARQIFKWSDSQAEKETILSLKLCEKKKKKKKKIKIFENETSVRITIFSRQREIYRALIINNYDTAAQKLGIGSSFNFYQLAGGGGEGKGEARYFLEDVTVAL